MLTYDHAYRTLSNVEWISEKRKKMKENDTKYTYIDMSIPIVAGILAIYFFKNHLVLLINLI